MKKLTIGIDMDDTIENLLCFWVEILNEKYNTSVNYKDIDDWKVSKFFPTLTPDQVMGELSNPELWKRVTPKDEAVKYVKKLIDDGHEVYICTSSHFGTVEMKMTEVLFRYFPYLNWNQVIVCSKKQICRFDILVDDYFKNIVGGEYMGILISTSANLKVDTTKYNNMIRTDTWEEIYNYISSYNS